MRYGDVLRYKRDQDARDEPEWLFMFLGVRHAIWSSVSVTVYHDVMVLKAPPDDDAWGPGTVTVAGVNELEVFE